jgi:hypothetical protein
MPSRVTVDCTECGLKMCGAEAVTPVCHPCRRVLRSKPCLLCGQIFDPAISSSGGEVADRRKIKLCQECRSFYRCTCTGAFVPLLATAA